MEEEAQENEPHARRSLANLYKCITSYQLQYMNTTAFQSMALWGEGVRTKRFVVFVGRSGKFCEVDEEREKPSEDV